MIILLGLVALAGACSFESSSEDSIEWSNGEEIEDGMKTQIESLIQGEMQRQQDSLDTIDMSEISCDSSVFLLASPEARWAAVIIGLKKSMGEKVVLTHGDGHQGISNEDVCDLLEIFQFLQLLESKSQFPGRFTTAGTAEGALLTVKFNTDEKGVKTYFITNNYSSNGQKWTATLSTGGFEV